MTQLRETKCLTPAQIEIIINNWATVLGATSKKVLYKGKPIFSAENIKQWNLPHLTKFADNYVLYEFTRNNKPSLYIITIETDKFDKVNIQACIWFYHYFEDKVYKTQTVRPEVFICPCFVVTAAMFNHVPINIIPCMYRFVPIPDIYPMIGSKSMLYSTTWDYRRLEPEEVMGTREYSIILDFDPLVKILNCIPGDTIQHKRVLCEGSPYTEYYRRTVVSTVTDINAIAPSGICYGKYQGKRTDRKDDEDEVIEEPQEKETKTSGGKASKGKSRKPTEKKSTVKFE